MTGNVIIPAPEMGEIERQLKPQFEIHRLEAERPVEKFQASNVKFNHDDKWKERFWSLEHVRSGSSHFWNFIWLLLVIAQFGLGYYRYR